MNSPTLATHPFKFVGYAYPTSTTATKLGRSKEGCFFTSVSRDRHGMKGNQLVAAYVSQANAVKAAETMPQAYAAFSLTREA